MIIAATVFMFEKGFSEVCGKSGYIYTFNVNVGGPYPTKKIKDDAVSFDNCTKKVSFDFSALYSNALKKNNVKVTLAPTVAAPSFYGKNHMEYSVNDVPMMVTQTIFDVKLGKTISRTRTSTVNGCTVRVTNNVASIMGSCGFRIEEETLNGVYVEPFIGEFWFK